MKNKTKNCAGFTLLFAVLIMSIVLVMALGFSGFTIRELIVSGLGRESQKSLFASDSGIECALYWDIKQNAFATSSVSSTIRCADADKNLTPKADWDAGLPTSFTLNFVNGACAVVSVSKFTYPYTKIQSRGRNTCDLANSNRVERAFEINY